MQTLKTALVWINAVAMLGGFGLAMAWYFRNRFDPAGRAKVYGLSVPDALLRLALAIGCQAALVVTTAALVPILPGVLTY